MLTQVIHARQAAKLRLGLAFLAALAAGRAATFNIADGDVAGLIAAIQTANVSGGSHIINLAPNGTYTLTAVAEYPPEFNSPGPTGLPVIRATVTFNGNGATIQRSTASGTPDFALLAVSGRTASCGGDPGCLTNPSLTLNQTILSGASGAGLHLNSATALVQASTITANRGGGIVNGCGYLTVLNSTVSYNESGGYGGGGILSWNFSCAPGSPTTKIAFTTLFENRSYAGDSISTAFNEPGSVVVKNSILASPTRAMAQACWQSNGGAIVSAGNNIIADTSCGFSGPGDLVIADPMVGPLAANGGPTPTHLPLSGSPAINAVPLASCLDTSGAPVTTDQRGVTRPWGTGCDIGSVEVVRYNVCLSYEPARAVQSGATYPIKVQLCDSTGSDLSSSTITLHATSVTLTATSISGLVQASGDANPDNDFRFDPTLGSTGGYIFNLSTKGLSTGSYSLGFTVTGAGSFVYSAPFAVR